MIHNELWLRIYHNTNGLIRISLPKNTEVTMRVNATPWRECKTLRLIVQTILNCTSFLLNITVSNRFSENTKIDVQKELTISFSHYVK